MCSYEALQSVTRTMRVLEELNAHSSRRIVDLHQGTGIPTPTLVRILETLESMGYVRQISRMGGYCVTQGVLALAAGYHGLPKAFDGIKAAADTFTRNHLWPVAIATPDGEAMVVRYSTIPESPLAHKHSTINRRLDMLHRAHGRAYLAHCHEDMREHIYTTLIEHGHYTGTINQLRKEMEPLLATVRKNGLARRASDLEPETMTIASPVWLGGQVIATIGVTYFRAGLRDPASLVAKVREMARALHRDLKTEASA